MDWAERRPTALSRLPKGYVALYESAARRSGADPRVRELWVSGSLARSSSCPGAFYSLTPACERVDVVLDRASNVPPSFVRARFLVFDRDGLDTHVPAPFPPASPDLADVETALIEPLRYLALLPAVLAPGELLLAQEGYGHLRRRVSERFLEANAPLPTTEVKHWRDKLSAEPYAVLEALPWPTPLETAVRAHLKRELGVAF